MAAPPGVGVNNFFNAAVDESPAVLVHQGRTLVFNIHVVNGDTTDCYLQMYNAAVADITVGTTTPKYSFLLPGGTGASNKGAYADSFSAPLQFDTALSIAVTTGPTTNGAPTNDAVVNIGWLAG
jgi:hypothetical protein